MKVDRGELTLYIVPVEGSLIRYRSYKDRWRGYPAIYDAICQRHVGAWEGEWLVIETKRVYGLKNLTQCEKEMLALCAPRAMVLKEDIRAIKFFHQLYPDVESNYKEAVYDLVDLMGNDTCHAICWGVFEDSWEIEGRLY